MEAIIAEKLRDIEEKEQVRILYACESGSRAWGFASPDSDYDVRFVYVRKTADYLKLNPPRDVIEWQLDETLDINGWDLQKLLRLLLTSNPTIFEWNSSPIVYHTTPEWDILSKTINSYFQSKKGIYHYLHMATNNKREHLSSETVRLKKYFYVLRPIFACNWILKENTPPPMLFSDLCDAICPQEIRGELDALLERKQLAPESMTGEKIPVLNAYIDAELKRITTLVEQLPAKDKSDIDALNAYFYSVVTGSEMSPN